MPMTMSVLNPFSWHCNLQLAQRMRYKFCTLFCCAAQFSVLPDCTPHFPKRKKKGKIKEERRKPHRFARFSFLRLLAQEYVYFPLLPPLVAYFMQLPRVQGVCLGAPLPRYIRYIRAMYSIYSQEQDLRQTARLSQRKVGQKLRASHSPLHVHSRSSTFEVVAAISVALLPLPFAFCPLPLPNCRRVLAAVI